MGVAPWRFDDASRCFVARAGTSRGRGSLTTFVTHVTNIFMKRQTTHEEDWIALLRGTHEIAETFPDDVVFIGGMAVYLHSVASRAAAPAERSHDADLYISLPAFDDLRSTEMVTTNARLRKKQFVKYGMEYDVYLEHNHGLIIEFGEIFAGSVVAEGVRVASLEHLLLLKLVAFLDRFGTPKGPKDARDVIRIVLLLHQHGVSRSRLAPHFSTKMADTLKQLSHSKEFVTLTNGNLHEARKLRDIYTAAADSISKQILTAKSPRRRRP